MNGQNQEKRKEKMNLEYGPVSPPQVSWLFSFSFFITPSQGRAAFYRTGPAQTRLLLLGPQHEKGIRERKREGGKKINKGVFEQMQSVMRWKETPQMCSFPILALEEKEKKANGRRTTFLVF